MNTTAQSLIFRLDLIALTVSIAATLSACSSGSSQQQSGQAIASSPVLIKIDGSSTVFPVTDSIAGQFHLEQKKVKVQVAFSGTGGGFRKFCAKETDINNASRPILTEEMEACKKAGVRYIELPIGFDALTVVIHPQNDWALNITLQELQKMWEPAAEGKITSWKQIRSDWPDRPLKLYGAGKDSGTFDYFTEAVVGKPKASRNDYTATEDDNVTVQGVTKDPNALGYFGYAYYEANKMNLKPVEINNGKGAVLPSREAVKTAQYQPLSRPLFIYVSAESVQTKPEVREFVEYYLNNAERWVNSTGYVPLPDEGYKIVFSHFQKGKVGTVFDGKSQMNLKIEEMLQKESKF